MRGVLETGHCRCRHQSPFLCLRTEDLANLYRSPTPKGRPSTSLCGFLVTGSEKRRGRYRARGTDGVALGLRRESLRSEGRGGTLRPGPGPERHRAPTEEGRPDQSPPPRSRGKGRKSGHRCRHEPEEVHPKVLGNHQTNRWKWGPCGTGSSVSTPGTRRADRERGLVRRQPLPDLEVLPET